MRSCSQGRRSSFVIELKAPTGDSLSIRKLTVPARWCRGDAPSCCRRRRITDSVSTGMIAPMKCHVTSSEPVDKLAVIAAWIGVILQSRRPLTTAEKFNARSMSQLPWRRIDRNSLSVTETVMQTSQHTNISRRYERGGHVAVVAETECELLRAVTEWHAVSRFGGVTLNKSVNAIRMLLSSPGNVVEGREKARGSSHFVKACGNHFDCLHV